MDDEYVRLLGAKHKVKEVPVLRMVLLGLIVASPSILVGIDVVFSSIALPEMNLGVSEASWYASINAFGSPFGSLLIAYVIDNFGRRPALLLAILPCIVGWGLQYLSSSIALLLLGRFLTGVITGTSFSMQIYSSECIVVNRPYWRSSFMTWGTSVLTFGMLLTYFLGYLLPWRTVALIAFTLSMITFTLVYVVIPESPTWLHGKGRLGEAYNSEQQLRISQPILKTESKAELRMEPFTLKMLCAKVMRKDVRKPLILTSVLGSLAMLTGGACFLTYTVSIISIPADNASELMAITSSSYLYSVISGLFIFTGNMLVSILLPYTGIKKHYVLACGLMATGLFILGGTMYPFPDSMRTIVNSVHVGSVWLITFAYSFGVTTIPNSILGEMYPTDAKGLAACPAILNVIVAGVVVKFHPYLVAELGGVLYFIYGIMCIIVLSFMVLFVPETVGKTLDEIREHFLRS